MKPEEGNKKKFSVGLFLAIIFLVAALTALGFFGYRFLMQDKQERQDWQSGYAQRETPVPTSAAEATPKPQPEPVEDTSAEAEAEAETKTDTKTEANAQTKPAETAKPTETPTPELTPEVEMLSTEGLQSAYACMIRGSDGMVVLDKNAEEKIYPASMSKVMTAIVALENIEDLNTKAVVYQEDIDAAYLSEASMAGFEPYEEVTVLDLLFGVMLPSGAEACTALATKVAETEENFVQMMNDKAAELGMTGTHFENVTGLHDENHYTTCHDMTILMQYAMKNSNFRNIVSTSVYTCTPSEQHPEGLQFGSTLYASIDATTFASGAMLEGGKTGTTDEAGRCLVSAAAFYGEEYYLCTAQAPLDSNGSFDDAALAYGELTR